MQRSDHPMMTKRPRICISSGDWELVASLILCAFHWPGERGFAVQSGKLERYGEGVLRLPRSHEQVQGHERSGKFLGEHERVESQSAHLEHFTVRCE